MILETATLVPSFVALFVKSIVDAPGSLANIF